MSIKQQVFELCKEVWQSPYREEIATLLVRLNSISQEHANKQNDRSEFGYVSRRQNLQFCGYLLLDYSIKNNNQQNDLLNRLIALENSEHVILSRAHKTLLDINESCVRIVLDKIPECRDLIDPYSQYILDLPDIGNDRILDSKLLKVIGEVFSAHRGISWALETIDSVGKLNKKQYLEIANNIGGVFKSSPDTLFNNLLARDGKTRKHFKHFFALMAIRESLNLTNQLIYQAISNNKLAHFGHSNLISIDSENHNITGTHYSFTYLTSGENLMVEPGDLVLYQPYENDKPRLCRVLWENMSFSQTDGMLTQLEVVGINDELHPLDSIFNMLKDA